MFENYAFMDSPNGDLDDFGIFHLNVDDASALIAKILFLEGELEVNVPEYDEDYSLFSPTLEKRLSKQIKKYRGILLSGIERKTLVPVFVSRNIDETIRTNETYLKVSHLFSWLSERGINLSGDWYEEYAESESRLAESVMNFISVQRGKIKSGKRRWEMESDQDRIVSLERQIAFLKGETGQESTQKRTVKPLHVKERETLQKMIIGMAIKGYSYDPKASKNTSIQEIADDLASLGISLDPDTVRKWVKEAAEILPRDDA